MCCFRRFRIRRGALSPVWVEQVSFDRMVDPTDNDRLAGSEMGYAAWWRGAGKKGLRGSLGWAHVTRPPGVGYPRRNI